MFMANQRRRTDFLLGVQKKIEDGSLPEDLVEIMTEWKDKYQDAEFCDDM